MGRQLRSLALDESLSLVEEQSRTSSLKANPYAHFGRSDVKLLGGTQKNQLTTQGNKGQDFPSYRICEVRPPSIEKITYIYTNNRSQSIPLHFSFLSFFFSSLRLTMDGGTRELLL